MLPYGLVVGNAILDWDVDYTGPGLDGYGWRRIFDAEQCCLECLQVQGCSHWTTVPIGGEGHGCWLKTEQGETRMKLGAVSGSKESCSTWHL